MAFKVQLAPGVRDELNERQAIADEAGRASLRLGASAYELKRGRTRHLVSFRNADLRGAYDERASGGWGLEIVVNAAYLMTHALEEAIALAERAASEFGEVKAHRLRRFDLCADYVGFVFRDDDASMRVLTKRAKSSFFISDPKDVDEASGQLCQADVREYRGARREVTGFTVAPGNPLMARGYTKTTELQLSGREHKRELEYARWRQHGWDGRSAVGRLEFQHRGRVLDEMDLRDVHKLKDQVDAVWQHDVRWLRLIEPGTATRRTRCELDPRWKAARATVFVHTAEPIYRQRLRGDGAHPSHVRGAMVSMLGSHSKLSLAAVTPDGEVVAEAELADSLTAAQQEEWVTRYYGGVGHQSGLIVAQDELGRHGARGALIRAVAQNDGTIARFSSADDEPGGSNEA